MSKQKQKYIAGMEPPSIPELDKAAEKYVEVRDRRMAETKDEVEARDQLAELMRKHKLETYEADGLVVELKHVDKVKVRRAKEDDESGREDDAS